MYPTSGKKISGADKFLRTVFCVRQPPAVGREAKPPPFHGGAGGRAAEAAVNPCENHKKGRRQIGKYYKFAYWHEK